MKPKPSLGVPSRIFDRFAALRVLDRIPRFGSISITGAAELPRFYQNRSVTYVSEHVSHMSPVHTLTRRGICRVEQQLRGSTAYFLSGNKPLPQNLFVQPLTIGGSMRLFPAT